jgi:hypothetical protein
MQLKYSFSYSSFGFKPLFKGAFLFLLSATTTCSSLSARLARLFQGTFRGKVIIKEGLGPVSVKWL